MTHSQQTENSSPKNRSVFSKGAVFFLLTIFGGFLWFLGDSLARHLAEGKEEKLQPVSYESRESSEFKKEVDAVLLENLFPVEEFSPVKKEEFSEDAFAVPSAHASLILDAQSGTILYHNRGTERRQIASLTKVMTALLVMENVRSLDDTVTVTEEISQAEGTVVGCPRTGYCIGNRLVVGEKLSVRDLLRAMLMNSANDAAIALSAHISGSQAAFVEKMNNRAEDLGLRDTHFCTASGLEIEQKEESCYSTAYDIARVAEKILQYEEIWKIFQTSKMTIVSVDGKYSHDILNTDQILGTLPNIMGVKTGFTPLAGRSLLAVAHNGEGNHPIIAVLLNDPYRWEDVKRMISWAYSAYRWE